MRPFFSFTLVVFNRSIDEQKPTAGLQHARCFTDESFWRAEVVRGDAARHEIKRFVRVGEGFRRVQTRFDRQAAFARSGTGAVEHRLRDVTQRDFVTEAREQQTGVTAARCDIQHACAGRQPGVRKRRANIIHVLKYVTFAVAVALSRELFLRGALDFIQVHIRETLLVRRKRSNSNIVDRSCGAGFNPAAMIKP
jgi:hypothetical protein